MRTDFMQKGSHYAELEELIHLSIETGMDQESWVRNGIRNLSVSWNDFLYKKIRKVCLNKYSQPLLDDTFRIPVRKDELEAVNGPYRIGTIKNTNIHVGLTRQQLLRHAVFAGQSGFGKSTLVKIICRQLLKENKIFTWLLDPKGSGGDFRSLAKDFDNVTILRPDVLKCNPFSGIANVSEAILTEAISETTADAWSVFDAGEGVILRHVYDTLQRNSQPNALDFINSIRNEKGSSSSRRAGYIETLETRLTKAEISLGNIINCKEDYISKLFDKNVIFGGRTSFFAKLATQARAFGLSLVVLSQNPMMKLMREITANSAIKLSFQLGSSEEMIGYGRTIGMSNAQIEALHHFQPGEAVCRISIGYTYPMHLELYNTQDKEVSNKELVELMKPKWDKLLEGIEPAKAENPNFNRIIKPSKTQGQLDESVDDDLFDKKIKADKKVSEVKASDDTVLTPDEQSYLRILASHPWRLITETYSILSSESIMGNSTISQARAVKIRQKLIQLKLIDSFAVNSTGKPGKPQSDLLVSEISKTEHPRGGKDHSWWCYRVSSYYKAKGADVKLGSTVSGNELDINVAFEGKHIGIEIVISTIVIENLANHIKFYDEIKILAIDERKGKDIAKMVNKLDNGIKEKVSIELLKDYFIAL
ncbi:MAG: DUF87 domain-containing protein [Proteobacteria bacterium]|nr:DUF87 domain-containing protein [Pseudomonadota bacterium]